MAQASVESVVLETTVAEQSASVSPAVPIQIQKVKGRKRILQSLQRMSSSSSLAKLSRTPSSSYRTGGRGSVSCISLSSGSGSYGSYGNSLTSELSVGYSTAPTSAANTPGIPFPSFDEKTARSRYLASVPVPDFRTTTRIAEEEDYFSIPVQKAVQQPKSSFNFWKDLPSELAIEILSYLEPREVVRSSAVSKQWHSRCFDGQLWSILDTSDFYRDIPANALINIVTSAGPFVRDLNLRGCVQLREQWHAKGLSGACSKDAVSRRRPFTRSYCRTRDLHISTFQVLLVLRIRL